MFMFSRCYRLVYFVFFFFKQKTAYEIRISDWSSDVCSSDLQYARQPGHQIVDQHGERDDDPKVVIAVNQPHRDADQYAERRAVGAGDEIGRASCRERVCQYV